MCRVALEFPWSEYAGLGVNLVCVARRCCNIAARAATSSAGVIQRLAVILFAVGDLVADVDRLGLVSADGAVAIGGSACQVE